MTLIEIQKRLNATTDTGSTLQAVEDLTADSEEQHADNQRWRQEVAMESGMLHGVDAYNESLGQSINRGPDCFNCGGRGCESCDE